MSRKTRPLINVDANYRDLTESQVHLAFRGDYSGTSLTYAGFARPGAQEGQLVWQIRFLTYDVSGNLTKVEWPLNSNGAPSNDYEFSWTDRATYSFV